MRHVDPLVSNSTLGVITMLALASCVTEMAGVPVAANEACLVGGLWVTHDMRAEEPEAFFFDCTCVRTEGIPIEGGRVLSSECTEWDGQQLRTLGWDEMEVVVRWNGHAFEVLVSDGVWLEMERCVGDCPLETRLREVECPSVEDCLPDPEEEPPSDI